jgi:putative nucleotidyltransferase with HDIG domain
MRPKEYQRLSSWFDAYVGGFRSAAGTLSPPLELKRLHCLQVARNAREIADGLAWEVPELELARAAGLLHDIGRFTQYSRYRSFQDADTVDHGEEGHRVLLRSAIGPFERDTDRERLLFAVRYHNRKIDKMPAGASPGHDDLLRLVRDADKIDIMSLVLRSVEDDGFSALPTMLPGIQLTRELTPDLLSRALGREALSTASLVTLGDLLLLLSTWFYELNHLPSRRLARRLGIWDRLRRELPDRPELQGFFAQIAGTT